MGDTVVVTGGMVYNDTDHRGGTRVQVYNTTGEGERLPDMKTGRMWHACGHYIKDEKVVI